LAQHQSNESSPGREITLFRERVVAESSTLPPKRLGRLLRQARRDRQMSLEQAALACGRLTATELHEFETAKKIPSDEAIAILSRLYFPDGQPLVPTRLRLAILRPEVLRRTSDTKLTGSTREVLLRYLAIVHHLRGIDPGQRIELRTGDVAVLGEFVGASPEALAPTLLDLMAGAWSEIERYRFEVRTRPFTERRVNITIATTSRGALILTRRPPPSPGTSAPLL
jgi:hypothetical protein